MRNKMKNDNKTKEKKILLALLPFWDPLIPPMGITSIKSFLKQQGYRVKTVDANVELEFKDILDTYFDYLREIIPENKQGNFFNIGYEVLRNHLMVHFNSQEAQECTDLVKIFVEKTFFSGITDYQVLKLDQLIRKFYTHLKNFITELLEKEKPDLLGLSVYNSTLPASMFAFQLAKEINPGINTVMGGAIFAGELNLDSPDFALFLEKTPYIDKIIVGEGENLFLKLIEKKLPDNQRLYTLGDLQGEILNLKELKAPDFSDLSINYYSSLASYTSRSCPFQCTFCSETTFWGKYRRKGAKQIVEELHSLYKSHGCQLFLMCDSLLNPVVSDLSLAMKENELSLYWDGYLRAEKPVCDRDNTFMWRQGGFYRARLGVESGSQKVLDLMNKKVTVDQVKSAVSSLAYAGIKTTTYWVIGHPGETEKDFQDSLSLLEEMKDDIYEADCNPFVYFFSGQVSSEEWSRDHQKMLLYPEEARELLITQTWVMDCEPSREEAYQRVGRFVQRCRELGIPNPYSLTEIFKADERWKRLHKNAVPSMLSFRPGQGNKNNYIDENKRIRKIITSKNLQYNEKEWGF
jgi:radical SAM superfamily enzyme YgiQ (UPF0313 family)